MPTVTNKRRNGRIRPGYIDDVRPIWQQVGKRTFHASDLNDVSFRKLPRLVMAGYLLVVGCEWYGKKHRRNVKIYRINPVYVEFCKEVYT